MMQIKDMIPQVTIWDGFINYYSSEIPYKTMAEILEAFYYWSIDNADKSHKIMRIRKGG